METRRKKSSVVVAEQVSETVAEVGKKVTRKKTAVVAKKNSPPRAAKSARRTAKKKVVSPVEENLLKNIEDLGVETEIEEVEAAGLKPVNEIEELRRRLQELETSNFSGSKNEDSDKRTENNPVTEVNRATEKKRTNPTEGKLLGLYDGRTDLESFLTKFERCSEYFGWSDEDQVFQLSNALSNDAAYVVREVGPRGKKDEIINLLKLRFGNDLLIDKFRAELQNRKRKKGESLKDLYLDLSRLKINTYSGETGSRYPDVYFRDIYVNALGDKELRRAVLLQKPMTMEAAYNISCQIEAIDAYNTPVHDLSRPRHRVQVMGVESAGNYSPEEYKNIPNQR